MAILNDRGEKQPSHDSAALIEELGEARQCFG
jgi:hypothetical protein